MTIDEQLAPIVSSLLDAGITLTQAIDAFEQKYIATAKQKCKTVTRAAQMLGVHRNTLHLKAPSEKALRMREIRARQTERDRRRRG